MKKGLVLFALSFIFISCASESDSANSGMLRKIVYIFEDGMQEVLNFSYNGNKLDKISYPSTGHIKFVYSGDLITSMKYYEGEAEPAQIENYDYDDQDQITSYVFKEFDFNYGIREHYVHNDDGTVSFTRYLGDHLVQNTVEATGKIFFDGNEVSHIEEYYPSYTIVRSYQYDDKHNPYMDIAGYARVSFTGGLAEGILHNVTVESTQQEGNTIVNTTTYTYNDSGYPLTESAHVEGETITSEYFYY